MSEHYVPTKEEVEKAESMMDNAQATVSAERARIIEAVGLSPERQIEFDESYKYDEGKGTNMSFMHFKANGNEVDIQLGQVNEDRLYARNIMAEWGSVKINGEQIPTDLAREVVQKYSKIVEAHYRLDQMAQTVEKNSRLEAQRELVDSVILG